MAKYPGCEMFERADDPGIIWYGSVFLSKKGSTPVTGAEPFLNFKIGYISL